MLVTLFLVRSVMWAQSTPPQDMREKPAHDREVWRAVAKNKYAIPGGESAFPLIRELSGYLGSSDPELRDDLAYTTIATWIVVQKQLTATDLTYLLEEWRTNLRIGIGQSGADGVLKRSFSALCLAALAEREFKTPFLR